MHIDSNYLLTVDITSQMSTFVYYETSIPSFLGFVGKYRTTKTGAND